ncbi:MAG: permease [Candidatus Omnitrophica bacterium]|nr:permease [Candidatus Omnitrophota bacterium]
MAKDPICGMKVSEKSGLKLTHKGRDYFFCSPRCLKKFAEDNRVDIKQANTCLSCARPPFYGNKTFIVAASLLLLAFLSYPLPVLTPFRESLWMYIRRLWWAILLGVFIGGFVDYFIPREYITHMLAKPAKKTILYSVLLGFFMSACSHGILALSIELHKKGASNPAVVSFLLASPWANFTLTIMLIGFFGLKALFIILSAVVIAVITGFIFLILEKKGLIEKNENTLKLAGDFSLRDDFRRRFKDRKISFKNLKSWAKGIYEGMVSLSNMVLWWVLIGMGLASLAAAFIPAGVFNNYMGPTLGGLFVTLLVATIIEVCSEGSAPMAFEIFKQTKAFGNSFVFLMAGVVTDYTEIGLLWHNVGRKVALWLPIITVPQVILLGFIANYIFR